MQKQNALKMHQNARCPEIFFKCQKKRKKAYVKTHLKMHKKKKQKKKNRTQKLWCKPALQHDAKKNRKLDLGLLIIIAYFVGLDRVPLSKVISPIHNDFL